MSLPEVNTIDGYIRYGWADRDIIELLSLCKTALVIHERFFSDAVAGTELELKSKWAKLATLANEMINLTSRLVEEHTKQSDEPNTGAPVRM